MLSHVIKAECIKLRRAPIWIAFFTLPLLAAVMGTFNYQQNTGILTKEWHSLWTQHTLFASFFFLPSLLGLLAAYQWRLEHRQNNWNSLMAQPVSPFALFAGKLIVGSAFSVLTLLFTGLLYYACGRYAGFAGFPDQLAGWLGKGILGAIAIVAVQLLLSMVIRSFAIPVGIALMGGIVGLAMTNAGLWQVCPYSLIAVGMNANGTGMLTAGDGLPFFLSCALFVLAAILLAAWRLRRHDVETK